MEFITDLSKFDHSKKLVEKSDYPLIIPQIKTSSTCFD